MTPWGYSAVLLFFNANVTAERQEPAEVLSQLGDMSTTHHPHPKFTGSTNVLTVVPLVSLWQLYIFVGKRYSVQNVDLWRCMNGDSVPDKPGCSCRIITHGHAAEYALFHTACVML